MTKRRKQPPPAAAAGPAAVPVPRQSGTREIDILAAVAALICIGFGFLAMNALNPDGVSYLDLAAAMQRGDWRHFVQGYWSPLLPFMVGVIAMVTGLSGSQLIPVTHIINLLVALGGLFIIWRWVRKHPSPVFGRSAIVAFMLCSAGLPRIEAVTPDVLLLFTMVWLSYELLVQRGRRWLLVGGLLGAAFLVKTSAWPWLLVAVPLRIWGASDASTRRQVWWSSLTCALVMLAWIVPVSLKYGHPTLGSAGRLNYSWYIEGNTSRMPDTDRGRNTAYHAVPVGGNRSVVVASFDDAANWTYQPWGDPTDWATRVLSETGYTPSMGELIRYWLRQSGRIFALWLAPLIAGVLLPSWVLLRRPGMFRELITTERGTLVVIVLGVVGLAQFAAVHAEPRLIAPFGAMMGLGVLNWFASKPPSRIVAPAALRSGLAWFGAAVVVTFAAFRLAEGVRSYQRLRGVAAQLDDLRRRLVAADQPQLPLGVVGPVAPVLASVYSIGARVVMQVSPSEALPISGLPPEQQAQALATLFTGRALMVWLTTADGGIRMFIVPQHS